jgi:hypothetical protein
MLFRVECPRFNRAMQSLSNSLSAVLLTNRPGRGTLFAERKDTALPWMKERHNFASLDIPPVDLYFTKEDTTKGHENVSSQDFSC